MARAHSIRNEQTRAILEAVASIYESPLDDGNWSIALDKMCALLRAPHANLSVIDAERSRLNFVQGIEYDPAFLKSYDEYYLSVNPARPFFQKLPETVGTRRQLVPDAEYFRTEYYNDWARPQDLHDDLGYLFNREAGRVVLLNFTRPRRKAVFGEPELELLGVLAPHINRVVALRRHLWDLQERSAGAIAVLERLPLGVILLDRDGLAPC